MKGKKVIIRGRSIARAVSEGEALVTRQPFMFPHGIDPESGRVIDVRHELYGSNVSGKVFVFPYGKGSTTGSTWILEVIRNNKGPLAIINLETDPTIATGVILGELLYGKTTPTIDHPDKDLFKHMKTGDFVKIDSISGIIEVYKSW
jgi:predicted aconitase with swiveling domain